VLLSLLSQSLAASQSGYGELTGGAETGLPFGMGISHT
jgi:hypothetical protein